MNNRSLVTTMMKTLCLMIALSFAAPTFAKVHKKHKSSSSSGKTKKGKHAGGKKHKK